MDPFIYTKRSISDDYFGWSNMCLVSSLATTREHKFRDSTDLGYVRVPTSATICESTLHVTLSTILFLAEN
jgi:hypothetical protein